MHLQHVHGLREAGDLMVHATFRGVEYLVRDLTEGGGGGDKGGRGGGDKGGKRGVEGRQGY